MLSKHRRDSQPLATASRGNLSKFVVIKHFGCTEAYKYHSRSELEKSDIRNPNCKSPKFGLQKSDIRNPTWKSPRSEIRLVKKYEIRVVYHLRYATCIRLQLSANK